MERFNNNVFFCKHIVFSAKDEYSYFSADFRCIFLDYTMTFLFLNVVCV